MSRYSQKENEQSSTVPLQQQTKFFGQGPGAEEEPVAVAEAPVEELLTPAEVTSATRYMRNSFSRESITSLREKFGLSVGHNVDRELVLAVAQYQDTNGLDVDGKLGPDTYDIIMAEGDATIQDVILFRVSSPFGGRMRSATSGGTTDFEGSFTIEIHLPPGADCGDYQYRQFICARIEMLPAGASPAGPMDNLRPLFSNPGGLQPIPSYREDGNTNLTPQRMGHRSGPGSSRPMNRYEDADGTPNQLGGCIYRGEDHPGINGRVTNTGEQYEFDFRFMGQVVHKDRGVVAKKFWSVQDDFLI